MIEHIELIRREIEQLRRNLERAKAKPGVQPTEIQGVENKIRLKTDILHLLEGRQELQLFAVFWKKQPTIYCPVPRWESYCVWTNSLEEAQEDLDRARHNPRYVDAKIVVQTTIHTDYEVQKHD